MTEYISREEAIKELREVYENEYPTASGDFDEYASHDVPNVLRNIPSADVQPVNQWISVDDKLPDTVDDCLVWYSCDTAFGKSKSVGISFCSRDDWYKQHLNGDNIVVLYWMPLPEPPKDGDTECHDTK